MNYDFLPDKNLALLHNQADALRSLLLHRQLWAIVAMLLILAVFSYWTYYWMLVRPGKLNGSVTDWKPKQRVGKWGMLLPIVLIQLCLVTGSMFQLTSFFKNFQSVPSMAHVAPYVPLIKYYLVTEDDAKRVSRLELNQDILPKGYEIDNKALFALFPDGGRRVGTPPVGDKKKEIPTVANEKGGIVPRGEHASKDLSLESAHPVRNVYIWKVAVHGVWVLVILEALAFFLFVQLRFRKEEGE